MEKTIRRRGFLAGILAAGVAPALARSGFLMPVRQIVTPADPYSVAIDVTGTQIARKYADNLARSMRFTGSNFLRAGDIITLAGVTASSGALQQFTVTAISGREMTINPTIWEPAHA